MSKKLDETLEYLNSGYSIEWVMNEKCIYRKIGNFEIEVSGLDNREQKYEAIIYIWDSKKLLKSIPDISSKEELAKHLEIVAQGLLSHQD